MARIRLVQGRKGDGGPEGEQLRAAGHAVDVGPIDAATLKAMRAAPPAAVVIDLDRGFSVGRDVAMWLRQARSTRGVPIVFVGGEAGKVERLREQLPDATFAARGRLLAAVRRALAHPPADPVKPASALAGY